MRTPSSQSLWIRAPIVLILIALSLCGSIMVREYYIYIERQDCLCSLLTDRHETYPIDQRLNELYNMNSLNGEYMV